MFSSINKLYLIGFLKELTFSSAILLPFYFSREITEGQVFILLAIYQITILVAEIPTGLIASKFGEKKSIMAGFLVSAIFFFGLPLISGFWIATFFQILSAISVAFLSGSFSAFINDLSKDGGGDFLQIRSRFKIITLITGVIATIAGGFMLHFGYTFIFSLQAICMLLAIFVIHSIQINPYHQFKELEFLGILGKSYQIIRSREVLIPTIFIYSFLSIEAAVYTAFQTDYITRLQLNPEYLGIFLSIFLLFSIGFTHLLSKKKWILNPYFLAGIACIFIVTSSIHLYFGSIITLLLLYFTQIIRPMDIHLENLVFSKIESNIGSTILSLMGFFERILFLVIAGVMNIFALGALETILYFSVGILCIYLCAIICSLKMQGDKD